MMRIPSAFLVLCLLTGCTLFPEQAQSNNQKSEATEVDPRSLPPGQWCRVTLREEKRHSVKVRAEQIGQLQQADDGSITLAEVTTRSRYESLSPIRHVPYVGSLYKKLSVYDGVDTLDEPTPVTLPRDRIERIEPISPEVAAELKRPVERIGIDFDFSLAN